MAEELIYVHKARRRGAKAAGAAVVFEGRALAPWSTTAARDGNPILPDEVYRVLLEECAKHPGPAQHDTFGIVLNATAWRTRHLGMGLSRKTGGQRVDSPVGEIAEDIICRQDGHHWDVLGGAAVGAPLQPGQGPSIGVIDLRARPWVAPVEPAGQVTPPVDQPGTPPAPQPQPSPVVDAAAVLVALARVESVVGDIRDRVGALESRDALTRQEFSDTIRGAEVMGHIRSELAELRGAVGGIGQGDRCRFPTRIFGAVPQPGVEPLDVQRAPGETPAFRCPECASSERVVTHAATRRWRCAVCGTTGRDWPKPGAAVSAQDDNG